MRHDDVRDVLASMLKDVCADVEVEPSLQPLSGESFRYRSTLRDDDAHPDIRVRGFWDKRWQDTYVDVRVFHPDAPSYRSTPASALYRRFEADKKRHYGPRIRDVEHGTFTPIVFSTLGGSGRECSAFLKRLSARLAEKHELSYSQVMCWVRCSLSFSLLRASLTCLRGTRHRRGNLPSLDIVRACKLFQF